MSSNQKNLIQIVLNLCKRTTSLNLFLVQYLFFAPANYVAKFMRYLLGIQRFPTFAVHRIADLMFVAANTGWLSFLLYEFHAPSWPKYLPPVLIGWLTLVSAFGFLLILVARFFNHHERRLIIAGALSRRDPRRHFPDGWASDDLSVRILAGAGWVISSIFAIYMFAQVYFNLNPTLLEVATFLFQNDWTARYMPAGTFSLPNEFEYIGWVFQGTISLLILAGISSHHRVHREISTAWKELFYGDGKLSEERIVNLLATLSGVPPIWKRRLLNILFKHNNTPIWRKQSAIRLVQHLEVECFGPPFTRSLHKEKAESIKIQGLKVILYLMENSPDLFGSAICKQIKENIYDQMQVRTGNHSHKVMEVLSKIKRQL